MCPEKSKSPSVFKANAVSESECSSCGVKSFAKDGIGGNLLSGHPRGRKGVPHRMMLNISRSFSWIIGLARGIFSAMILSARVRESLSPQANIGSRSPSMYLFSAGPTAKDSNEMHSNIGASLMPARLRLMTVSQFDNGNNFPRYSTYAFIVSPSRTYTMIPSRYCAMSPCTALAILPIAKKAEFRSLSRLSCACRYTINRCRYESVNSTGA